MVVRATWRPVLSRSTTSTPGSHPPLARLTAPNTWPTSATGAWASPSPAVTSWLAKLASPPCVLASTGALVSHEVSTLNMAGGSGCADLDGQSSPGPCLGAVGPAAVAKVYDR